MPPSISRKPLSWPSKFRHFNPLVRIGIYLGLCVSCSFAWACALLATLHPGLDVFTHPEKFPLASSLYMGGNYIVLVGMALWLWRQGQGASFASLGLRWGPASLVNGLRGTLWGLGSLGALFAIELLLHWLTWDRAAWARTPFSLLLANGATALFFGFSEELLFRGFVFQTLRRGLSLPVAILLSAWFYAQVHFLRFDVQWHTLAMPFLGLFLAGIVLAWTTYRTRSLWFAVGLHSAWVYLFVLSDRQRLLHYPPPYQFLNGGGYPLAGLAALVLLAVLGILLVWRLSPSGDVPIRRTRADVAHNLAV